MLPVCCCGWARSRLGVALYVGQVAGNRGVRTALLGLALFALVATGLAGAAWTTTAS